MRMSRPWWCAGCPRENAKTWKWTRKYDITRAGQCTDFNRMESWKCSRVKICNGTWASPDPTVRQCKIMTLRCKGGVDLCCAGAIHSRGMQFHVRWCKENIHDIYIHIYIYIRRKFRSQTSDNMDRWKAEQGRGREKRKIRRKKSRRERVRRKKMQMREKVGKSRNTFFSNDLWLRRVEK